MTDVVDLHPRKETWSSGIGKCLDCGHRWAAAEPSGTIDLVCPKCETKRGVWYGSFDAPEGLDHWLCGCGCDTFRIVAKSGIFHHIICLRCGKPQEF